MARRRRHQANIFNEQMTVIYRQSRALLFAPVRNALSNSLQVTLNTLVDENRKAVAPVLKAMNECDITLMLQPTYDTLELITKFFVPSPERDNLPSDTWLDAFSRSSFDTSFKVDHPTIYGRDPYLSRFRKKDSYSNVYVLEMSMYAPYTIDGQTPLPTENEEILTNMLGYIMTIRREFPTWAEQFRNQNHVLGSSYAAYYSSTVGNWLRSLNFNVTPYVRRPNCPYTVAMSPELNAALCVALSLKDAKSTVDEAYL
jgi:hypothetical protein